MYFEVILLITRFFLWCSGIISIVLYARLSQKYKLIASYLFLAIGVDLLTSYFIKTWKYNLFLLPAFSLLELFIFSKLYVTFFLKKKSPLIYFFIGSLYAVIGLDIVYFCDLYKASTFYALSKVVTDIGIILFCLLYYWEVLIGKVTIQKEELFLNAGFLSYFSINLLIFVSINFLVNESFNLVTPFWIINLLSALILYLFLTYMIWQHGKAQKILHAGSSS